MAAFLEQLVCKYNKIFHWKYFASSHCKGIDDGIGGKANSTVRSLVSSKEDNTHNIRLENDFCELVEKHMPSTKVVVIMVKDICRHIKWNHVPQIPGISKSQVIKFSKIIK